jgi:hypothetical protein
MLSRLKAALSNQSGQLNGANTIWVILGIVGIVLIVLLVAGRL